MCSCPALNLWIGKAITCGQLTPHTCLTCCCLIVSLSFTVWRSSREVKLHCSRYAQVHRVPCYGCRKSKEFQQNLTCLVCGTSRMKAFEKLPLIQQSSVNSWHLSRNLVSAGVQATAASNSTYTCHCGHSQSLYGTLLQRIGAHFYNALAYTSTTHWRTKLACTTSRNKNSQRSL